MKDECTNPQHLGDEQLETVSGGEGGGSYVQGGHVCGSFGQFEKLEDAKFDFEIGTRVQVTRSEHTWSSWSATIVDRKIESKYLARLGLRHCVMYKVHFDGYDSNYDDWYDQERLYI